MTRRPATPPVLRELGRMAGGRPSLAAAARAAAATGVPLLVAHALREPDLIWAAIGGFVGALVDRGGSYRARADNLAAVTAAIAAAGVIATLLGHSPVLAVAGMLVWGAASSFLRVYGTVGANMGLTSSVIFAVSVAMPGGWAAALARGGWLFAGGAWAALLGLSLWPLRPLLPSRRAVGRCYAALAMYAREIAELAERGSGADGMSGRGFDGVRQALEEAWEAVRAGGRRPGGRGSGAEQLLVLLETADQALGALVALSDVAERVPQGAARIAVAGALRGMAGDFGVVGAAVQRAEGDSPARWWFEGQEPGAAVGAERSAALAHANDLLRTLREFGRGAREALEGVYRAPGVVPAPAGGGRGWGAWIDPVRANLSGESVLLRHALRVGVTAALAVAISHASGLEHGHWITLTVLFILQPYAGLTLVKGLQRVVGTVLGGVVAALIPLAVRDPETLLVLVSLLGAAAVVTLPMNYAVFAFFVTPTFVLLAELQTASTGLAGARLLNTLVGAALAVAGARLLWSMPERRRFPVHAAAALRATRAFVLAVAEAPGPPASADGVAALRRELGLAIINAGESFQRLVIEEGGGARATEPERVVLVYLRRLAAAAVALATAPPSSPTEAASVRGFVAGAESALASLADALADGRPPPRLPPLISPDTCPRRLRPELERIDRAVRVLHSAAARVLPSPPESAGRSADARG